MKKNVNFPIGSIVLLDKIDNEFGFFSFVFENIGGKAKDFKENVKLLMHNKLSKCVSVN